MQNDLYPWERTEAFTATCGWAKARAKSCDGCDGMANPCRITEERKAKERVMKNLINLACYNERCNGIVWIDESYCHPIGVYYCPYCGKEIQHDNRTRSTDKQKEKFLDELSYIEGEISCIRRRLDR